MALILDSFLLELAIVLATIFGAVYVYIRSSFTYWKKLNVPCVEPSFPFGNFASILFLTEQVGVATANLYKKLEGHKFGGTYMFTKKGILVRDPDMIKDVLIKDFSSFHDRGIYINEEVEPLTGHLFMLPGARWRNLRVKLTPTFTSGKMKMMFQTLVDCGEELKTCLEESARKQETIEMKDLLARFSTDVISSCAFGIQCNCLKNENAEFRQWGRKVFTPTFRAVIFGLLSNIAPFILDITKFNGFDSEVSKYFRKMVSETVEYREKNNVVRNDFMHLLIQLKNKGFVDPDKDTADKNELAADDDATDKKELSMESLAAQVFVFFIAGFETSSTTMQFCLYELSVNPEIQERLRDEINTVLIRHDGKVTYEAINEMAYLDMVVSETLRKYPPLPMLNRECTKEYTIPDTNIVLKPGTSVIIPILGIQHDPKYYPNPERFDPERFSEEEKTKRHNCLYLPFGEGPRICIGMRFGLMQTKVGLVSLLSKYRIDVSEKTPIPLVLDKKSFILSPAGGMWLKIKNR
ncbi:probable cytochrome P450 6a13 [Periplaneta americana]|uniref:probable cytochrome P450 6a13 n=1 Tax=Periplaneta americana TaxID=6978 RepID=UPI0037E70EFC